MAYAVIQKQALVTPKFKRAYVMKRSSLLFTLIISLFLIIISSPARAQSEETPAGKIIEKVICRSDASQS